MKGKGDPRPTVILAESPSENMASIPCSVANHGSPLSTVFIPQGGCFNWASFNSPSTPLCSPLPSPDYRHWHSCPLPVPSHLEGPLSPLGLCRPCHPSKSSRGAPTPFRQPLCVLQLLSDLTHLPSASYKPALQCQLQKDTLPHLLGLPQGPASCWGHWILNIYIFD